MRNPARLARRRKNRAHRIERRAAQLELADWIEQRARQRRIIQDELIGLQVHRPQPIVVTSI